MRLYGVIGLKGCDRQIYDQVQKDLQRHAAVISLLKKSRFSA
jgi:adenylate cyclase